MGKCDWCGGKFPKTRATRKYCSTRCKTNACLGRKPRRIRAADVEALHALIDADFPTAEALRDRLREILTPDRPPIPVVVVPRLD